MKLKVCPGVCGLESLITAESEDGMDVNIQVETKCKAVKAFIDSLEQPLDSYEVCFAKPGDGPVYEAASENLIHSACPVASALLKCIEAECKLALPKDVSFTFVD